MIIRIIFAAVVLCSVMCCSPNPLPLAPLDEDDETQSESVVTEEGDTVTSTGQDDTAQTVETGDSEGSSASDASSATGEETASPSTETSDAPDSGSEQAFEPRTAAFLVRHMGVAQGTAACDLTGDGKPDNAIGDLLGTVGKILGEGDIGAKMDESILAGNLLIVYEISGIDDYANDERVDIHAHGARLSTEELPADLFEGTGEVALLEPPSSVLEGGRIDSGALLAPEGGIGVQIPIGEDKVLDLLLESGQLTADISAPPDDQGLHGALTGGRLCGAVDKQVLGDLLADLVGEPLLVQLVRAALNGAADVECHGKKRQCLSAGLEFDAVTVRIVD